MALVIICVALIATACERAALPEAVVCPSLKHLNPRDAERAAGEAMRRGDHRLLGVNGYSTEVPGAELPSRLSVRIIDGTSDSDCPKLNAMAREYAERYNRTIQGRQVR